MKDPLKIQNIKEDVKEKAWFASACYWGIMKDFNTICVPQHIRLVSFLTVFMPNEDSHKNFILKCFFVLDFVVLKIKKKIKKKREREKEENIYVYLPSRKIMKYWTSFSQKKKLNFIQGNKVFKVHVNCLSRRWFVWNVKLYKKKKKKKNVYYDFEWCFPVTYMHGIRQWIQKKRHFPDLTLTMLWADNRRQVGDIFLIFPRK